MKFLVTFREVNTGSVSVKARSEEEAKELAREQYYAGNVFWKDTEEEITDVIRERERGEER